MRLAEKLCVGRWINKPFSIKSGKSSDFYRKKYRSRFISLFFNWQILFINDSFLISENFSSLISAGLNMSHGP